MDLKYLDKVLTYLVTKGGTVFPDEILNEESLKDGKVMDALGFLSSDGYSMQNSYPTAYKPPYWDVAVTTKGIVFHNQGGYVESEKIRKSPLSEVKFAKWAFWIAIVSLLATLFFWLDTKGVFK